MTVAEWCGKTDSGKKQLESQYRFMRVDALKPYANNAMKHKPREIEELADLIEHGTGWTSLVVADEHGIIAGHKRVMAAQVIYGRGGVIRLPGSMPDGEPIPVGMVPVLWGNNWTPAQRRAYIIQDNQHGRRAEMDDEILQMELASLEMEGFDLEALGFNDEELERILNFGIESADEEEEEEEAEPQGPDRNVALAILLNPKELGRWKDMKEVLGASSDRAAFLKMLEQREKVEESK